MTAANVEELHGIFQFTDDLFEEAQPAERVLKVDKNFNPRLIYPCWFETFETSSSTEIPIDNEDFLIPELYRRGEWEKCLEAALCRINRFRGKEGSAGIIRDAAETASLCCLKLNRAEEALDLLHLMTGVEEPGRLLVRSRVFYECGRFAECAQECQEYLRLRPGDYFVSLRLVDCIKRSHLMESSTINVEDVLDQAENTLESYISESDDPIRAKYIRDLEYLNKIRHFY